MLDLCCHFCFPSFIIKVIFNLDGVWVKWQLKKKKQFKDLEYLEHIHYSTLCNCADIAC